MNDDYGDVTQVLDYDDFFDDIDGSETVPSKSCFDCDKVFATNGLLEMHRQKVHEDPSLLACVSCNVDFKRKMGLITHWRTAPAHRRLDGVKLIGCDICDAFNIVNGFRDEEAVESHTRHVHGEHVLVNTPEQAKSFCPLCRSEFAYRKGMIEHLQVLHGEHLLTELLGVTGSEKERLMEDLHFKCHSCAKVFRVKKSLNQHMEKMHGAVAPNYSVGSPQPKPATVVKLPSTVSLLPATKVHPVVTSPSSRLSSSGAPPPAKMARLSNISNSISQVPTPAKNSLLYNKQAPLSSSTQATCKICHRTFTRQSVLNVHTQMVHGKAPTASVAVATMVIPQHEEEEDEEYEEENVEERKPMKSHFNIISKNVDGSVEDFLDGESLIDEDQSNSD